MANTQGSKGFSASGAALAAALGGIAVGLLANSGRKAFVQGMESRAGEWDDILKAEHQATMKIFDRLSETTPQQTAKRTALFMHLKHALSKHAHEEENVVYPAMREHGLTQEADHLNHDHGYVKQFLFELGEMKPSNPAWLPKVEQFRAQIEEHVSEEEDELFPKLRAKLGDKGNAYVTAAVNREGFAAA